MKKRMRAVLLSTLLVTGLLSGCGNSDNKKEESRDEVTELTLLVDNANALNVGFKAVTELAEKEIGIKINVETRPSGTDGDNMVKTRLASGDMTDLLVYNSGALLNAMNPEEYFIDISQEDFSNRLDDSYKKAVSVNDAVFGVPYQSSQAEAIMYSKPMYEKYGLEIPKTWDEFLANCDVLKEAGETAILGTFADAWTAQIPYLGDAYNLTMKIPDFAEKFDAGEAKWATTPEALNSFEKLADTTPYYNEDYLATTYDAGCDIMANGGAGHWFILSKALTNIYGLYEDMEVVDNLGFFPIPDDNPDGNGMTLWYPPAIYGNKNSENQEAVLKFMEFYISDEALDAYCEAALPDGPFCVKDYELPEKSYKAVSNDIQPYFDEGKTAPALEYVSQVKGVDCPAICQELASGQTTAVEAAEKYDKDCEKQAKQLGLNW